MGRLFSLSGTSEVGNQHKQITGGPYPYPAYKERRTKLSKTSTVFVGEACTRVRTSDRPTRPHLCNLELPPLLILSVVSNVAAVYNNGVVQALRRQASTGRARAKGGRAPTRTIRSLVGVNFNRWGCCGGGVISVRGGMRSSLDRWVPWKSLAR